MAKYMDANGHGAAFARAFMLDPVMTGALAPSSCRLALAVVAPLRARPETFVVEIGCGTGVSLGKFVWRNLPPAFTWCASNA